MGEALFQRSGERKRKQKKMRITSNFLAHLKPQSKEACLAACSSKLFWQIFLANFIHLITDKLTAAIWFYGVKPVFGCRYCNFCA